MSCRVYVFVTVPHFLELLLLSGHPSHRAFCSNLKYVILDEVHIISEELEGPKVERIIQMLPCPFLAMSATVGNPDSFVGWLRRCAPRGDVRLVCHKERFSDLHMHLYLQDKVLPFNPVAALHFNKVLGEGLAEDFYLPPVDSLNLYLALSRILKTSNLFSFLFNPSFYFQGTPAITKKQYSFYWQTMRAHFVYMVRESKEIDLEAFLNLQNEIQSFKSSWVSDLQLFRPIKGLEAAAAATAAAAEADAAGSSSRQSALQHFRNLDVFPRDYLQPEKLLALCRTLDARRLLPALIFNFSRPQVRRMGIGLSRLLEDLQHNKYYGTEEAAYRTRAINKQRMERYEELLLEFELARRMHGLSRQQREAQGLTKEELAKMESEGPPPPPEDIAKEIDPEFSFANPKALGTNFDEIKHVIKEVHARSSSKEDLLLVKLLERGVGLFDDGLSKSYRVAVELLYRWGFLRIIICTHALALGMNLPCRSAVFAGDALALTPTMFKQAGGRAGRRGYDAEGHIIFWEVPLKRINRLLEARLPLFSGEFPVTPMLCLRTLRLNSQLEARGAFEQQLDAAFKRLFLNPLFSLSASNKMPSEEQLQVLRFHIRYHVRFTSDLLLRSGLLARFVHTEEDCGLNIFGFIAELLYENGSGAVLLLFLLLAGCLGDIAADPQRSTGEKERLLLQLLCLCCDPSSSSKVQSNFVLQQLLLQRRAAARQRARAAAATAGWEAAAAELAAANLQQQAAESVRPFSPKLPRDAQIAVEAFYQMALRSTYSCLVAAANALRGQKGWGEKDVSLPFTGLYFGVNPEDQQQQQQQQQGEGKTLLEEYKETVHGFSLQSPFGALSCMRDEEVGVSLEVLEDNIEVSLPFPKETLAAAGAAAALLRLPRFAPPPNTSSSSSSSSSSRRTTELLAANSYLSDLYVHGKLARVVSENGVPPEQLWLLLQHFVLSLSRLSKGLLLLQQQQQQQGGCSAKVELLLPFVEQICARMKSVLKEESA
ncbi:DEAD/DEAH box helicase, putative [Eimeria tenella]|uniref:DEAD/DEAH box helicase, putative n=1 Tax=Eimeria tenella TaxID=5802 RepID=U6KUM1_EIMTE|nr:DEAD/DEAH box helicase, putative [Eimeria tenella]CDJ41656.1 DEAD/DEAH box helicase, putative [Eimeria tenella]|eukprot:XP_013232406.1 DEAD/DEAH box helicase, putative [Eimeria tenella]